jgi:hypothetical protein
VGTVKVENADRKETTKGVAQLGARVQDSCAKGKLLSRVEKRQEEQRTREEDCLDKNHM